MKTAEALTIASDTPQRVAQFPRTVTDFNHSLLNDNERQELLTIEQPANYERAKALLDKCGVETAKMKAVDAKPSGIPVDIWPVFPAAGEK